MEGSRESSARGESQFKLNKEDELLADESLQEDIQNGQGNSLWYALLSFSALKYLLTFVSIGGYFMKDMLM